MLKFSLVKTPRLIFIFRFFFNFSIFFDFFDFFMASTVCLCNFLMMELEPGSHVLSLENLRAQREKSEILTGFQRISLQSRIPTCVFTFLAQESQEPIYHCLTRLALTFNQKIFIQNTSDENIMKLKLFFLGLIHRAFFRKCHKNGQKCLKKTFIPKNILLDPKMTISTRTLIFLPKYDIMKFPTKKHPAHCYYRQRKSGFNSMCDRHRLLEIIARGR